MKHHRLTLGDPFFGVSLIENAETWQIGEPTIVLNIGTEPIRVEAQQLAPLQSAVLVNTEIHDLERVVLVEGFADHSDEVIGDDTFERLLTFPNVLVSAHQAFLTDAALEAIATTTLSNLDQVAAGLPCGNDLLR